MPIVVRHDANVGALAGLSALASAMQRQPIKINVPRGGGRGYIKMAPETRSPYFDMIVQRAFRRGEREDEAAVEAQQMQLKAQLEREEAMRQEQVEHAEQPWIEGYSPQAQQRIAKRNNGIQETQRKIQSGEMRLDVGMRIMQGLEEANQSEIKTRRPRGPNDPPQYPDGQGIGQEWTDKWGNVKTRKPSGEIVTQVTFDKTEAGIRLKADMERQAAIADFRQDLSKRTKKEITASGDVAERPLTTDERLDELEYAFPELRQQRLKAEAEAKAMEQIQARDRAINRVLRRRDREVTKTATASGKVEREFKEAVKTESNLERAQEVVRKYVKKYKRKDKSYLRIDDIPDDERAEFLRAAAILDKYAKGR